MTMTKTMNRTMTVTLALALVVGLVAGAYALTVVIEESEPTAERSSSPPPEPETVSSTALAKTEKSSPRDSEDTPPAGTPDPERSSSGLQVAPGRDGSLPSITPLTIERRPPGVPKPPSRLAKNLCNLTSGYIGGLRDFGISGGAPGAELRDVTMVLGDQVSVWLGLASSFPPVVPDIERAALIRELWQEAAIAEDNGDTERAEAAIGAADEQIARLPTRTRAGGLTCR